MRISSFTPATRSLFRFQDQDRGRLFSDVVSRVDQRQLEQLGLNVLETGESVEEELALDGGKECYVLRVLPYRDANGAIDGVILVFSDVTKIRQTQADLARNEGIARQQTPRDRHALQDRAGRHGGGGPQPPLSEDQPALRRPHRQSDRQPYRTDDLRRDAV